MIVFVFISASSTGYSAILPDWNLLETKEQNSEYLLYQLSYSGFLTAFVWKDLANVAFQTTLGQLEFDGYKNCDISMKVSTEKYALAETLRSTRFNWHSKISPDLKKIYLVEKIDLDARTDYEVTWVDWKNKKIDYLKTPEKEEIEFDEWDEEYDFNNEAVDAADEEIIDNIPLLMHTPDQHQDKTQLVLANSIPLPDSNEILDPLSFLYAARWNDYKKQKEYFYDIAYKDEIRQYSLHYLGNETLTLYGKNISTIKIEAKRKNEDEADDEGFLVMWLTDSKQRIPVNFIIDGVIGDIRVRINEESLQNNHNIFQCSRYPG